MERLPSAHKLVKLPIVTFDLVTDNTPAPADLPWPEGFAEWTVKKVKEEAGLWSPVTYKPGKTRVKGQTEANLSAIHALVLDYDHGSTLDSVAAIWAGYEFVLYTTFQHTDSAQRFRAVLPFTRPMTTGDFRKLWAWAQQKTREGGAVVDALSDPGRIYFIPTHPPGKTPEYRHYSGELLDPDVVLALPNLPPPLTGRFTPQPVASPPTGRVIPFPGGSSPGGMFTGIGTAHQRENVALIEEKCAFMRHCREDAVGLPEPEWRSWLSIVARCKDGDAFAHTVSAKDPRYNKEGTDEKIKRLLNEAGPHSCAHIRGLSDACKGCPQNVTGPVMLGREQTVVEERAAEVVTVALVTEKEAHEAVDRARFALKAAEEYLRAARFNDADKATTEALIIEKRADLRAAEDVAKEARHAAKEAKKEAKKAEKLAVREREREAVIAGGQADLDMDKEGRPRASYGNVRKVLLQDGQWAGRLWKDVLRDRVMVDNEVLDAPVASRFRAYIADAYGLETRPEPMLDAFVAIANETPRNPLRDNLESLTWDGVPRLDLFASAALGNTGEVEKLACRMWLISGVARIMVPGDQVDYTLALVGRQRAGKTSLLRALAGNYGHNESKISIGERSGYTLLREKWLIEFAEGTDIRHKDMSAVKQFLTAREDNYVPPYGRMAVTQPRWCFFAVTVNDHEFLTDETGNARFWPVEIGDIDVGWVSANREQILAEALVAYRQGEAWFPDATDHKALELHRKAFEIEDTREAKVADALAAMSLTRKRAFGKGGDTPPLVFRISDLLAAMEVDDARRRSWEVCAATILRKMGWKKHPMTTHEGVIGHWWKKC